MKLKLINIDELCEHLPNITNWKIFENRKFSENGLFSQQLFGPITSYSCGCSKNPYKGPKFNKDRCPKCGVEIIKNDVRKKRYAKISLPFEILNPAFYYLFTTNKVVVKKVVDGMLSFRETYYFDENDLLQKVVEDTNIEGKQLLTGLYGCVYYIKKLIDKLPDRPEHKFILENIDQLTIHNILIIPPEFRPIGKESKNDDYLYRTDDINSFYGRILKHVSEINNCPVEMVEGTDLHKENFKTIQRKILQLYEYLIDRMSKKKGIIRSNILGKRVDFSGRAVISPDPTLNLNECRLPYLMILEIMKPELIPYLVENNVVKRYNHACKLIEDCIKNKDTQLLELVQHFCKNKLVALNRQPTLHRLSILGFNITVHVGSTIQIHPMICPAYNADFDGDAMAAYFPVTAESEKDIIDKVGVWNNILSPTDLSLVPQPNQDIILGIYTATKENTDEEKVEYKGQKISVGRMLFNKCLPEKHPVVNETITGKKLKTMLNNIALMYKRSEVITCLDALKELGFYYSTIEGYTISIMDFYNKDLEELAEKNIVGDMEKDMDFINNSEELKKILDKHRFTAFIESGARGSWQQAKQLIFTRGYVADAYNQVRPNVIKSSLCKGLSPREFFDSAYGCRKGLLDTAISTGDSGYLTRQLIYSTCNTVLGDEEDCGTNEYLVLEVKDKQMAKSILWRYYVNEDGIEELITKSNFDKIIGKVIKLRTPLYCKGDKICKKCYGKLHTLLHSDQCGIVATQAVGERATQLVLRTFHLSGSATSSNEGSNEDIISGMSIAKKLFHSPMSLDYINDEKDLTLALYDLFSEYGNLLLVHYEIIVQSMMWVEDKLWRTMENRETYEPEFVSILQIPTRSSWLLASAFANLKQKLMFGLISDSIDESSSITQMFRY